jgi:SAM-dependent methyltransferase
MIDGYHASRMAPDPRRAILWTTLCRYYFNGMIPPECCVLDMGCGYGDFINNVTARRRIAVDIWPDFPRHVAPEVQAHVRSVTDLSFLADDSVDFAFASNLFEHLTQADFVTALGQLRTKLRARGRLVILQPNYRYAYRDYFDDYTHIAVYSHVSLVDILASNGYEVLDVYPRFLPLTIRSRLPVWPILIRAYLRSPLKPFGKQMLLLATPRR